jgi:chemotaxis family two-component system sensor kinase Cph1
MNQVSDRAVLNLSDRIEQTNAVIMHELLPVVQGDEAALFGLLMNLVANAIKFCRAQPPRIKITAMDGPAEWIFSVTDNGIGIEAEYRESIFEMFRRLHTQAEFPGTGIGLASCKRIVERHHGRIWVESQLGEGSTFRFTIPKLPQPGVANGVAN